MNETPPTDDSARAPRIEALRVERIGPFGDLTLRFPPIKTPEADKSKAEIHLFVGPNGSGKSTLLYALAGAFDWHRRRQARISSRMHADDSVLEIEFVGKSFSKRGLEFASGALSMTQGYRGFANRESWFDDYYIYSNQQLGRNPVSIPFCVLSYSGNRKIEDTGQPVSIGPITFFPLTGSLDFSGNVASQQLIQWVANSIVQRAIAKSEGEVAAATRYDESLSRISQFIRQICDLDVQFQMDHENLRVRMLLNGETMDVDALPDGLRAILSWICDLAMRVSLQSWVVPRPVFDHPIILLLDEIDIHLHPAWQRRLLPAVQALLPNAQIFATTHSPFVVSSVTDAWVYVLPESGGKLFRGEIHAQATQTGIPYRQVLRSLFGIESEFDVATERKISDFYEQLKVLRAQKTDADLSKLLEIARDINAAGLVPGSIVERELRQLSRELGREVELA